MTDQRPRRWRRRRVPWPRGVRGRLVATYLLAAAAIAIAGVLVLTITLANGLRANVDAGLHTHADALAADVAAGNIEHTDPGPSIGAVRAAEDVSTVTAVIDPTGTVIESQPVRLPASPPLTNASSGPTVISTPFGGIPFRILTIPVHRSDGTWQVVAGQSLESANEANTQVRRALLIATPVLLLLVGLGAWLLSGSALKPVERMRADAQRLSRRDDDGDGDGDGDTGSARLSEPDTGDSLARLARTFNQLLDRLHHSLRQQRGLVADAGHELRTPLAVLQTELETAVRPSRTRADLVDSISHAHVEVQRLAVLCEDLLLLALSDGILARELTDIGDLLDETVGGHQTTAAARAVLVQASHPPSLLADVDPSAVRRIVDNLLANAIRYASLQVWIEAEDHRDPVRGAALAIRVRDDGPGFPHEFLPHAFERFTRADQGRSRADPTSGTGLGLAIVRSLVAAHHGTVTATNPPGGGAEVTIRIPNAR